MIIGYARVSTEDQSLRVQEQAIQEYTENQDEKYVIYQEKQSEGKERLTEKNISMPSKRHNEGISLSSIN